MGPGSLFVRSCDGHLAKTAPVGWLPSRAQNACMGLWLHILHAWRGHKERNDWAGPGGLRRHPSRAGQRSDAGTTLMDRLCQVAAARETAVDRTRSENSVKFRTTFPTNQLLASSERESCRLYSLKRLNNHDKMVCPKR